MKLNVWFALLLAALFFGLVFSFEAQAESVIIYVNHEAAEGQNNGSSWEDAYVCLHQALSEADQGDVIWVAAGTYRPVDDHGLGIGDRGKHFRMKNGVEIYGGFAGDEDPQDPGFSLEGRDFDVNETILSGDLLGNDSWNVVLDEWENREDNVYHVFNHPHGHGLDETAVLDGFTISGGHADGELPYKSGGGIYNGINNHNIAIRNVVFTENVAEDDGGGLVSFSEIALENIIFVENISGRNGGGLYSDSNITLENAVFVGNIADRHGGGARFWQGEPVLEGVRFENNKSNSDGGGLYLINSDATLENVKFTGNQTAGNGGGIHATGESIPTLKNVMFTDNEASSYGGGMSNYSGSASVLNNVSFIDNIANGSGGGIYCYRSSPSLDNVEFRGNTASIHGGGMYNNEDCNPTLNNVLFIENISNNGGGMRNRQSDPVLNNVQFTGNHAKDLGGGISNTGSSPDLINVIISGNSSENRGGGIQNTTDSDPVLVNVLISGNNSGTSGGGMSNNGNCNPILINVTISGNKVNNNGGGIYNLGKSEPVIINCIIWNNYRNEIYNHDTAEDIPVINHSIVQGALPGGVWDDDLGVDGGGNLDEDPKFVDPEDPGDIPTAEGDYRLKAGSPAIDVGTDAPYGPGEAAEGVEKDLDGNPRQIDDIDMGPYELPDEGTLTVVLKPQDVAGLARWSIDGGTNWHVSNHKLELESGTYTITFKPVENYITLAPIEVELAKGMEETREGLYREAGFLKVDLEPDNAREAGARWRVAGYHGEDEWQESGVTVELPVGTYTVTFMDLPGWLAPEDLTAIELLHTETQEESGTYKKTGTLTVNIGPEDAVTAGAQWSVDGENWHAGGSTLELSVGSYTVLFGDAEGWVVPAETVFNLEGDEHKTIEGIYRRYGDITGDDHVDIGDVIMIAKWILQMEDLSGKQLEAADVNEDGQVNVIDVVTMMSYILEIIDSLPVSHRANEI